MVGERILIVEDEQIVAEDLHDMLKRLGYSVAGMASTGEDAIRKSEETWPDLVLMDIRLNGAMDGIEAAETIWAHQGIPVTYVTAYADESTLERAKTTMPFGYILKPFEERDIRTAIELALYKCAMETTLRKMEGWHASTLGSLAEAVVTTNTSGGITFMNPAAETLTGWPLREIYGKKLNDVIRIVPDKNQTKLSSSSYQTGLLTTKDGHPTPIEFSTSPIKEKDGQVSGHAVLMHGAVQLREPQSTSKI